MCRTSNLETAFSNTRTAFNEAEVPSRVNVLVNTMQEVGQKLLEERDYYLDRIKNSGTQEIPHDATQEVDRYITAFINWKLMENRETRGDRIILEDISIDTRKASVTWIGDGVDATKRYLEGGGDFGSALMVVTPHGKVIASLYLMPAGKPVVNGNSKWNPEEATVYFAIPDQVVWCNGKVLKQKPSSKIAIVRWPRKKEEVPQRIQCLYKAAKQELRDAGYQVESGQALTAADVLLLVEGEFEKFVYYSKPWDFLIGAAIAHVAGAKVELYDIDDSEWKDVFPLDIQRIASRDRILFRVERRIAA